MKLLPFPLLRIILGLLSTLLFISLLVARDCGCINARGRKTHAWQLGSLWQLRENVDWSSTVPYMIPSLLLVLPAVFSQLYMFVIEEKPLYCVYTDATQQELQDRKDFN